MKGAILARLCTAVKECIAVIEPFWHAKVLSGLHLELEPFWHANVLRHSGTLMYCSEGSHSGTLMYGSEGSHSGTLMYCSDRAILAR